MIANLNVLHQKRQLLADCNLIATNAHWIDHDWLVGKQVLIANKDATILDENKSGTLTILQAHANGTVTIQQNSTANKCIKIWQLRPYRT